MPVGLQRESITSRLDLQFLAKMVIISLAELLLQTQVVAFIFCCIEPTA